jgi:hypothetical protein
MVARYAKIIELVGLRSSDPIENLRLAHSADPEAPDRLSIAIAGEWIVSSSPKDIGSAAFSSGISLPTVCGNLGLVD